MKKKIKKTKKTKKLVKKEKVDPLLAMIKKETDISGYD